VQISGFIEVSGAMSVENLTFSVHLTDGNVVVNFLLKTTMLLLALRFVLICPPLKKFFVFV